MTETPELPEDSEANNPDSEWLLNQVRAALSMGLTEVEDIRDLLNNADVEISRAKLAELTNRVSELAESKQEIFRRQAAVIAAMVDGPTRVAQGHLDAQTQMLKRAAELAPSATSEELASLMIAYSRMPKPYAQGFYWPLGEDERSVDDEQEATDEE